jgi:hypothetical protein
MGELRAVGDKLDRLQEGAKANGTLPQRLDEWRAAYAERRSIMLWKHSLLRRTQRRRSTVRSALPRTLLYLAPRRFPGPGDRFDQAGIVITHVPDARADRPAEHVFDRVGSQARLELGRIGRLFAELHRPGFGRQYHRHPVMNFGA